MTQSVVSMLDADSLGEVKTVLRILVRSFPKQPRKFFDQQELRNLAESIKRFGQIVPASVRKLDEPDADGHLYELINGQRRWHAIDMAGLVTMKVIVQTVKDEKEQFLLSVLSNFGSAKHGPMEVVEAIIRFQNDGMPVVEIADVFAMSDTWVYQHLKIAEKLHPEVQRMMSQEIHEDDRLAFSTALMIADVPSDLQLKIAKTIVSKKLKTIQVKGFIQAQGKKHGFSVGNPNRTPRKDYEIVRNFFVKLKRDLEVFTGSPQSFFDKMFEFREPIDNDQMCAGLKNGIEKLGLLLAMVGKAKKK